MDAHDELMVPGETATGPDVEAIKAAYGLIASAGIVAGVERLLTVCHEDVEMQAYAAQAAEGREVLHGREEVLGFFTRSEKEGFGFSLRTKGFDVDGDRVVVPGTIRVSRPDGSFAETSVRWTYRFRDGLVEEIGWEPRAGE